ncbi:MAG: protein translocase subunit SecD [Ilumatobacteraceae bacterium]|jgi:preprotein translocase subunit SecD|nr:protein translocase subunit SecD [Ilumatobacteraceae bacterium]MDP5069181.1 protein translocase subunit SecD [Ilumatobacteraceae bacterium]
MTRRLVASLVSIVLLSSGAFIANIVAGNFPALGLDLQGGASVTMTPVGEVDEAALSVAVDIIRQRVDSIGVAEPEIIRQGNTVVVNLPGVKDQQQALDTIGRTGAVEMRPVIKVAENPENTTTTTVVGGTTTTVKGGTTTTLKPTSTTLPPPSGGVGSSRTAAVTTTTIPTATEDVDPLTGLPQGQTILPGRKDGLIYLLGPIEATGEVFSNDSSAQVDAGAWVVVAKLRSGAAGADVWNALSTKCFAGVADCPTKAIAIILDGEVISAPTVQTPTFDNGSVQISGSFSETEAQDLARVLQFGAVPVKFDIPTVQTVSASLGEDSLRAAVLSGLVGLLLVLLFLLFYYRLIAIVVIGGLALSGLMLWSVISWLSKTNGLALTLSGAAGIIVSVGVTVDSYVVFFEKLKDDVQLGRTLRNSAARGFDRAWRTILIADTVSLIGALILWQLTVGSVRGFAFFLGLSTLSDMVVSYFFARPAVLLLAKTKMFNRGRVLGVAKAKISEAVA